MCIGGMCWRSHTYADGNWNDPQSDPAVNGTQFHSRETSDSVSSSVREGADLDNETMGHVREWMSVTENTVVEEENEAGKPRTFSVAAMDAVNEMHNEIELGITEAYTPGNDYAGNEAFDEWAA